MNILEKSQYAKYFKTDIEVKAHSHMQVIPSPVICLEGKESLGIGAFRQITNAITQPFDRILETHYHDFDQFMSFFGGDMTNMMDLGGEIEFTIGEEGKELETFTFTKPFMVHIPPGVRHCPLKYTKVNDPTKPMIHQDLAFTKVYVKKTDPVQK